MCRVDIIPYYPFSTSEGNLIMQNDTFPVVDIDYTKFPADVNTAGEGSIDGILMSHFTWLFVRSGTPPFSTFNYYPDLTYQTKSWIVGKEKNKVGAEFSPPFFLHTDNFSQTPPDSEKKSS